MLHTLLNYLPVATGWKANNSTFNTQHLDDPRTEIRLLRLLPVGQRDPVRFQISVYSPQAISASEEYDDWSEPLRNLESTDASSNNPKQLVSSQANLGIACGAALSGDIFAVSAHIALVLRPDVTASLQTIGQAASAPTAAWIESCDHCLVKLWTNLRLADLPVLVAQNHVVGEGGQDTPEYGLEDLAERVRTSVTVEVDDPRVWMSNIESYRSNAFLKREFITQQVEKQLMPKLSLVTSK